MNAAAQLAMFEPEGVEAVALLKRYMREADQHAALADRFEFLGLDSPARLEEHQMLDCVASAQVLAILLDLEREAGL